MKSWYQEEWEFEIEVLQVGQSDKPEECRLGLEPGDTFTCSYGTPTDFCPTSFIKIFPTLEIMRCQGDLRYQGSNDRHDIKTLCPDGVVLFEIRGQKSIERGESSYAE